MFTARSFVLKDRRASFGPNVSRAIVVCIVNSHRLEWLTKRSAAGFLLRRFLMLHRFISRHNSNVCSDKLLLTSATPAAWAAVVQTPKATPSTLYADTVTVNAGKGVFLHGTPMATSA